MLTWTIGAGGLLGRAVASHAAEAGGSFTAGPIRWSDSELALADLASALPAFSEQSDGRDWSVVWAAGAATVSSSAEQATRELTVFRGFLEALAAAHPSGEGRFLLASSAGGVYAGSQNPPFGPSSEPAPVGTYGRLKLDQELAATNMLAGTCPVVLARIANLYGPGQNLAKLQGLISRLAWCAARQEPANIFVPLDTIRDYIDADDAARTCLAALSGDLAAVTVHVVASGRPVTVGQLIKMVSQVTRRRVPVALGTHTSARDQVLDLRLQPSIEIDDPTPLPAGVKRVYLDILARMGAATALPA